jgi:hypothetical protein
VIVILTFGAATALIFFRPFWLALEIGFSAIVLVLVSWLVWAIVQQRRYICQQGRIDRNLRGLCPNCGYDLAGSPERCPECGEKAPVQGP